MTQTTGIFRPDPQDHDNLAAVFDAQSEADPAGPRAGPKIVVWCEFNEKINTCISLYIYIGLYGIKWDLYRTKTKKTPMKLVSLNRIRYGLVPGLNGTVDNELLLLVHRNLVEVYTVMWISTCTSWDVDGILMNRYRFMWTGTRWLSWDTANDLHFRHISGWFYT